MNEEELNIIKKAMLHEDEGAAYYTLQAEQWHETSICENFRLLAEEERLHSKWIKELFDERKSFGDSKLLSFLKCQESPKLIDWSDIKKISDLSLKDVFKKAMDMEKASYNYYAEAKSKIDDKDTKALLDILIEWEMQHYTTLKKAHDSL